MQKPSLEQCRYFLKDAIRQEVDFSQTDQGREISLPPLEKPFPKDAGHVCQNLYLACQAVGAGTCAVGAYHQELMDRLVQVDGADEFVIYLAPVGKVRAA